MQDTVTILVVDDHELVRQALIHRLQAEPEFKVVGGVGDADSAVAEVLRNHPDLVLMDIDMPGRNAFDAVRMIHIRSPQTRVIFLSALIKDRYVSEILDLGAAGYLLKDEPMDVLIHAVRLVSGGGTCFSSSVKERLNPGQQSAKGSADLTRLGSLTAREREVLLSIARGLSRKAIARAMNISIKTVERHSDSIMRKLDIHDRVDLTRFAIREGLVEP